jgi:gas vesicle protein
MEENGGAKMVYFLAGIGIGALIGILFAPQSGEQTRELIAGRAEEGRDYLNRRSREVREQAATYVDRGKEAISHQRDQLASAIEAGKQAYRAESDSRTGIE